MGEGEEGKRGYVAYNSTLLLNHYLNELEHAAGWCHSRVLPQISYEVHSMCKLRHSIQGLSYSRSQGRFTVGH